MRTFVTTTETPARFWNIELKGKSYTITAGKVGSKGRSLSREFPDELGARNACNTLIRRKLNEGFQETTPPAPAAPTQQGLEAALVDDPDDLAAHKAYADFLHEQGDLRGDLIQVQLALEQEGLPKSERKRLAAREKELLAATGDDCVGADLLALRARQEEDEYEAWTGPLTPYAFEYAIRRGWLSRVVQNGPLTAVLARGLTDAPQTRLLRELIFRWEYYPFAIATNDPGLIEAVGLLKKLKNLRVLALLRPDEDPGFAPEQQEPIIFTSRDALIPAGNPVWDLVAALPGLEELYLSCRTENIARLFGLRSLGNLRILQINLADSYPLDVLARNKALKKVTHLSFHPLPRRGRPDEAYLTTAHLHALARSPNLPALTHLRFQRSSAGDEGVRMLIESGLLRRLEFLDLAMGTISDAGADLLAGADVGRLKVLDVSANAITPSGQRRLRTALNHRLTLRMNNQGVAGEAEWLYEGEVE
jgi:uncharacterized protein (TIGR02996 family)